MPKKIVFVLIFLAFALVGVYVFFPVKSSDHQMVCAFCDPKVIISQKFYEDSSVMALYTHKPIFPGHCLIISKRHVERFEMLSKTEIKEMGAVIKKVHDAASKVFHTSSYMLLQKNGYEVGQTVPHVHVHYIAREKGDDSKIKLVIKLFSSHFIRPISEIKMKKIVDELKEEMKNPA